jgi:TPR repeat protein
MKTPTRNDRKQVLRSILLLVGITCSGCSDRNAEDAAQAQHGPPVQPAEPQVPPAVLAAQWDQLGSFTVQSGPGQVDKFTEETGEGTTPYEKSLWLEREAIAGDAQAQCSMGLRYLDGYAGTPVDATKAAHWFKAAAEQGHAEAQYHLGNLYSQGKGVDQDDGEAARWIRTAAEQNEPVAEFFLGSLYYEGKGVARDTTRALRWLHQSADHGVKAAGLLIGIIYFNGDGVEKDPVLGLAWVIYAGDNFTTNEANATELMTKSMTPEQIEEATALAGTLP